MADPVPAPTTGGGNINVIIRILSPGDDGPVQQISDSAGGGAGPSLDWNWTWTWNWACAPTTAAWDWDWTWAECGGGLTPKVPAPQTRLPFDRTEQPMPAGEALDAWQVGAIAAPLSGARERSAGGDPSAGGIGRRQAASHGRGPHGGAPTGGAAPGGAAAGGSIPPGVVSTESFVPIGDLARTPAGPASRGDRPVRKEDDRDDRRHDPAPPAPGPAATASTGGGGIGSLLLAAVLAGLLALAPRPAREALARRRAPKNSLGSSRPERPG